MAMAAAVTPVKRASLNPLKCGGTSLPTNLLLMAKLVAVCMLLTGEVGRLPDHFLPFFPFFDHVGSPAAFQRTLQVVFVVAAVALLLNRAVRVACVTLGLVILIGQVSSRVYFANNLIFCGCLFFLVGLHPPGRKPWLIRVQVALVYLGAGLNKLLEADWHNGRFFEAFVRLTVNRPLYSRVASWLPPLLLSKVMSWTTIVTELSLTVGLLLRRFYKAVLWVAILFQVALLIFARRSFAMFFFAMMVSYLAFIDWPHGLPVFYDGDCGFCTQTRNLFARLDLEGMFDWVPFQQTSNRFGVSEAALHKKLHLVVGDKVYAGFAAFKMMLLYNPITYFVLALLLATPWLEPVRYRLAFVLLVFFSPVCEPVGEFAYDLIARNRHQLSPSSTCAVPERPARTDLD